MKRITIALSLILTCGCSTTARLYPVDGPYSKMSPAPVIEAVMTGARFNGDINFTLPDGPKCKGEWSNAGIIDGSGSAIAMCSDGRRVELDFKISTVGTKSGNGTGKDTKGNSYRFIL